MKEKVSGDGLAAVLMEEGLQPCVVDFLRDNRLVNLALHTFGVVLDQGDPRWWLIAAMGRLTSFRPQHMENALTATYASSRPSYRQEYGKWRREPNLRQLVRAVQNVGYWSELQRSGGIFETGGGWPKGYQQLLRRTHRIAKGADASGVTGCPEALYQFQLWSGNRYLGRIGFNRHWEGKVPVLTIANIQGVPGASSDYSRLYRSMKVHPFNQLVRELISVAGLCGGVVRGISPPPSEKANDAVYRKVFQEEMVPTLSPPRISRKSEYGFW